MLIALLAASAFALTPEDAQVMLQIEAQRLPPLALATFVASDDPETRARAARALGRLRTAAALAPLKRPLNRRLETILRHRRFLIGSYLAFLHLLAYEYLFVVPSTA